ncbi:MAG: YihA family ribosome biogenesis GTP-binding protein [Micavibrio aeruginosavorus]|uniref:Probable GTP-binding protein EngB n=1 Tax=Micavibrio aeruginosavorus TaxID=349221 RepID=A0A7T5R2T3_9BACT|nr:MAG: YihA family ribosome biogenesis GTP-binding protein [Micavibrio aeruginosavorus]
MTEADLPIEQGRKAFAGPCDFIAAVNGLEGLPPASLPEIAFAGRSNVGKSSLINALTGRKTLARTSDTPGRTQQLNFFDLGGHFFLVDMPGYGYAKVSKAQKKQWNYLIRDYLRGRQTLRNVLVLIDSRHGLKDSDEELMDMLDECAVPYRVVLTKADKAKLAEAAGVVDTIISALKQHAAAFPDPILTSAHEGTGIAELRALIFSVAKS